MGPLATAIDIRKKEGFPGLYKGLGAVVTGIVPKMAIRFLSFEYLKQLMAGEQKATIRQTFFGTAYDISAIHKILLLAGLGAGVIETVMVVNPMDVVKIRLQAQRHHSLSDPMDRPPQYRNAAHALYRIILEEGPATLYRGVVLTGLRQCTEVHSRSIADLRIHSYKSSRKLHSLSGV